MELQRDLAALIDLAGSQKELAERTGVSRTAICDAVAGRKTPGRGTCRKLGLSESLAYDPGRVDRSPSPPPPGAAEIEASKAEVAESRRVPAMSGRNDRWSRPRPAEVDVNISDLIAQAMGRERRRRRGWTIEAMQREQAKWRANEKPRKPRHVPAHWRRKVNGEVQAASSGG